MKKILIVEDDQICSLALSSRLKSYGYQTAVAPDAVSGVETALKFEPDLVLLDISMPAGNGFTVAERIQHLLPKLTPIIFLSASGNPEVRERARQVGAAAFLQKPSDPQELRSAIECALAGSPPSFVEEVYAI